MRTTRVVGIPSPTRAGFSGTTRLMRLTRGSIRIASAIMLLGCVSTRGINTPCLGVLHLGARWQWANAVKEGS